MKFYLNILILAAVIISGCGKKDNALIEKKENTLSAAGTGEKDKNFKIEYKQPRTIFKIEEVDLDNNGKDEYIVFSIANDSLNKGIMQFYKFDMMEIFVKDSINNSYKKISTDTVDFSDEYWIMNLEKDKSKQILIKTNMGGNDVVNSRGLYVFNYDSAKVKLIKYFDTGNPEIKDVNGDGNKEILVSDSFFGILPESSSIYYIAEIYKYNNGTLIKSNKEFKQFFDAEADNAIKEYQRVKDRVNKSEKIKSSEYLLYKRTAEIILCFYAGGDYSRITKFWSDENPFLQKNLAEDEYDDLKKFITKLPPIAGTI